MEFRGEWLIEKDGRALWHQGLVITDEALTVAYRQNGLINFLIENSAFMGVAVGMA